MIVIYNYHFLCTVQQYNTDPFQHHEIKKYKLLVFKHNKERQKVYIEYIEKTKMFCFNAIRTLFNI